MIEIRNFMKQALIYSLLMLIFAGSFSIKTLAAGANSGKDSKIELVVIDPGHGGKDAGASYGKWLEKDIVLDIALKVGKYITDRYPETKVIYTRTKDMFVPLHQRANIANKNDADLFISIHVNYVGSRSVHGTETFVLGQHRSADNLEVAKKENAVILLEDDYSTTYEGFDPNSPESYIMFEMVQDEYLHQSVELAAAIQDEFKIHAQRLDRSVKQAGFLVLRRTTMPSVLVEAGFISNSAERSFMVSESGKISLATSIFNAFKTYKKKIENRSNFHLVTEELQLEEPETKELHNMSVEENVQPNIKNDIFFSVQVAALNRQINTNSENFRGETKIFKLNSGKVYRYFSGKFDNYENAVKEKHRLKTKFNDAFVVAIENGKLISVKKAMRKM